MPNALIGGGGGNLPVLRLGLMITDDSVYPRHSVDGSHVAELARAIVAGNDIPPIVVDKPSLRIVDGVHRMQAWTRVLGRGGEVEVEYRTYPDDTALFLDAISLNSAHARKLDAQDRVRCALLLETQGVTIPGIASALHTTEVRVRELVARVVIVKPKGDTGPGKRIPAKPLTYPARGGEPRVLTPEQAMVMRSSGGLRVNQIAAQLIREINFAVADLDDPVIRSTLWDLHDAIARGVKRPPRKASSGR